MKRGFTLIELLIVMVIVGILVTIALPKYRTAMERGRATEGLTNLKAASDWINAKYVLNGNSYPANSFLTATEITNGSASRVVIGSNSRSVYFSTPAFADSCSGADKCIVSHRQQGDIVYYTLTAYNKDGELIKITCTGTDKQLCEPLGMTLNGSQYEMVF